MQKLVFWSAAVCCCKSLAFGSWFTSFSRVLPTSRVGYHAGKPIESVVYCLNKLYIFAQRNTQPPNNFKIWKTIPKKLQIFALISIDFVHVVGRIWSIVSLAKKQLLGYRRSLVLPFTTLPCPPRKTQPPKTKFFRGC